MPIERRIHVYRADRISDGARVVDFDELSDDLQQAFYAAVDGSDDGRHAETSATVEREFERYDVVRFTDYYGVDVA